jgi:ketosteroid isomerase-like protein
MKTILLILTTFIVFISARQQDTTFYGNSLSIWKKQANGAWKYVADAGVDTPKPR